MKGQKQRGNRRKPQGEWAKRWYLKSNKVENQYVTIVQGLFLFPYVVGVGGRVKIRPSLTVPEAW